MTGDTPDPTAARPEPLTAEEEMREFWDTHCIDCGHDLHPMDVCSSIVGGDQNGPDYCPCTLDYHGLAAAYQQAGNRARLDDEIRSFLANVETAAEDNGTPAVLIADLWALARDWFRDRATLDAVRARTGSERTYTQAHHDESERQLRECQDRLVAMTAERDALADDEQAATGASRAGMDVDALSLALQRGGARSPSHMAYHDLARCVIAALTDGRDDLGAPDEHKRHAIEAPIGASRDELDDDPFRRQN